MNLTYRSYATTGVTSSFLFTASISFIILSMSISILCYVSSAIIECRCYTCFMILSLIFFVFCFCFMKTPTCILDSSTFKSSIRSTISSGSTFARRIPIALSSSSNFSRTSPASLNLYHHIFINSYHTIFMLEFTCNCRCKHSVSRWWRLQR
jgi:hypothetical protein